MQGGSVRFVCTAQAHMSQSPKLVDHLTIHEQQWAYCPYDARASEHEWRATGGASIGEIEQMVRAMRGRVAAEDARAESG